MEQIQLKRLKKQQNQSKRAKTEIINNSEELRANVLIVQCLVEGLPLNIATRTHGLTFKTVVGGEECSIHPSSALFGKSLVEKNREDQDQ